MARALNSSVTGEGGALIPQDFMADLIELLRAPIPWRGSSPMAGRDADGNLTIPRLAAQLPPPIKTSLMISRSRKSGSTT